LPGNPSSQWDVSGAGDLSIQGFATDISVNKGETVHFKIKTDASAYTINIYRIGYYQGNGARKVGTGVVTATLPQTQPADLYNSATGLTDCGNWKESAHWDVPSSAVSGVYIAKLTRTNGGSSHIIFIVRDDSNHSDLYFQTGDATWQAYNNYGGNSLYVGSTSFPGGHAAKVSYNRPFFTRDGGGGSGEPAQDWFFNAEYPMIRWLERNGYNVTYTTDVDADRRGNLILNHKVYMSVGHDEYWSAQQRANVEAARNAGVHLGFFCGNEIYWKTRWEPSIDGTNAAYRTLVCYKEGTLGENSCGQKCDPLSTVWTGMWRDGCNFTNADGCRPENALSGQISWDDVAGAIKVPDIYKNLRFWRNTSIATLGSGQTATLSANTLGYEWDWSQYPDNYPPGRVKMSSTTINSHTHNLSLYKYSSGALVFGAGTVQWSWGLDGNHDRGSSTPDVRIQQATVNLFADMGVQPGSLQSGLVAATGSTDTQAPTTVITSPANNANINPGTAVTIRGTASDNNTVVGVDVSVDGGVTWHPATGTTNWTYSWTPSALGTVTIVSRGFDDIGNIESTIGGGSNTITVNITGSQTACPCTIFQSTDAPAIPRDNDGSSIEAGVKFRSNVNGYITGIRFYKGSGTSGTHMGHLWSQTGNLLASATFTNETTSGWQQVLFSAPVAITANTTYIASFFSSSGDYSNTVSFFDQAVINGPLKALTDGEDGPNGVYSYAVSPTFPTQSFQASNYYVDIVFNTSTGPDNTPPVISNILATPHSDGTATITWNTNELSTSKVDYNADPNPLTLAVSDVNLVSSHSITLNNLTAGTTYHYRVTSVDGASNSATSPAPPDSLSFTMPATSCNGTKPSTPGTMSGPTINICGSGPFTYSISSVTGATSYNWAVPAGLNIISNSGTSISVSNASAAFTTSGQVRVTASNSCGTSGARSKTIFAVAQDPTTISGLTSVTANQTGVRYSVTNRSGITFNWSVPPGATITSGQGTNVIRVKFGSSSGNVSVYLSNACGRTATASLFVTVSSAFAQSVQSITTANSYLRVYPNPATSIATVAFDAKQGIKYEILVRDLAGKSIIRESAVTKAGENKVPLNMDKYANGAYLVTLLTAEGYKTVKLYKENSP